MQPLDTLIREAEAEVGRVLRICNACRYCEGFCAVFPAMTRRLDFGAADSHYLANLCHGCGACLHACQYAPPHEFAVNVPRATARLRRQTWAAHAWPASFGVLYRRNGLTLSVALAASLALILAIASWRVDAGGNFYAVMPHGTMVALFAPAFAFAIVALGIGVRRFWRAQSPGRASRAALGDAGHAIATLRHLDGGHGDGCNESDDAFTLERRRAHHLVFYGFLLCFAATCVGTLYHYVLGRIAPYPFWSLPKLLGTAGGIGLVVGSAWLYRLHLRRAPLQRDDDSTALDRGFIALLFAVGASGLLLMLGRATAALPLLLALHLGTVLALFLTLPYSKFAHGIYRAAALLKWSIERRRPHPHGTAGE